MMLANNSIEYPEGNLRISVDAKKARYYQCVDGEERYLHSSERALASALAQKKYNEKVYKLAHKRYIQLEKMARDYEDSEIDQIYDTMHPARKEIVVPVEETIEQKYNKWLNEEYRGKDFKDVQKEIYTEKGERVRSKSEKILADFFYRNGIEYKYEKPLFLDGMLTVYPDFTFFSMRTGREIYWEHDGRMDDPAYARAAIRKIETYERNGIFPGENLILTFETENIVLNTETIKLLAKRYLL